MGCTIKTSFCSRVTFSRRSPVAMSNGCAPVLASYSAITLFTSSMSAVAGSYSRSVVSPWDENVSILAFMFGLLRDVHVWSTVGAESEDLGPSKSYCTVSESCQDGIPAVQMGIATRFSGLTAGGTGNTHRRFVLQQDRRKQNKRNLSSSGRREEPALPSGAMGCPEFPGTPGDRVDLNASFEAPNEMDLPDY